ncbi:hypothetical protein BH10ACI3_BH10ACI3_03400 [soil metagenome]
MIEIEELSDSESIEVFSRIGYAHLACCQDDSPYVIPVHYAYDKGRVYVYTTEGKKAGIIRANPNICLQAEEVVDNYHWESVIVDGVASQIKSGPEFDRAIELIVAINPTLTPAVSIRWMDDWVRENIEVVYSVTPTKISGRRTVNRTENKPFVAPIDKENGEIN